MDFTPALRQRALEQMRTFVHGPLFTPPSEKGTLVVPGPLGGANWGGAAFDPDTAVLYVPSRTTWMVSRMVAGNPKQSNFRFAAGGMGPEARRMLEIEGLPLFKPPYSRVTAIDMGRGEHLWVTPIGNGPRAHPLLRDLNLPPLGDHVLGASPLVTKTLLFVSTTYLFVFGEQLPTAWAKWADPDANRKLLYVMDKRSGTILRAIELDGLSAAAPMTYLHRGKQYVVVATGGGPTSALVALSLE